MEEEEEEEIESDRVGGCKGRLDKCRQFLLGTKEIPTKNRGSRSSFLSTCHHLCFHILSRGCASSEEEDNDGSFADYLRL